MFPPKRISALEPFIVLLYCLRERLLGRESFLFWFSSPEKLRLWRKII